jgi:hypothetical protein
VKLSTIESVAERRVREYLLALASSGAFEVEEGLAVLGELSSEILVKDEAAGMLTFQ